MLRHSGIGRYLRNLLPLLLPLLEAESIRILTSPSVAAEARSLTGDDPRVDFIEAAAPIYSPAEQMLPFTAALRDPGLLWVPHYNAPLLYRGPLVLTIHDIAPVALPETFSSGLKRRYAQLLLRRSTARAQAILCASQFTASELTSRMGVAADKLTITYQGVDTGWPTGHAPYREPDGVPYLLFVGNIKPNKNLGLLLDAFAQVLTRIPHRLVLAGRMRGFGTGDEGVIASAKRMGDRVRFAGEVTDDELIALYAGASALVFPSLYEGFGLPLVEAMQYGCPVLASSAGSLPEIAGNAALSFDPRNAAQLAACLLQTLDADQMQALAAAGRERVTHFSYAACARQTAEILNRVPHHFTA